MTNEATIVLCSAFSEGAMADRDAVRALAERHIAAGDPTGWFEALYASAGQDTSAIPWADRGPNPNLVQWLDRNSPPAGTRALVVGCGLGDDAEELARRALSVTAFDVAPSAVRWCGRRFPHSGVSYVVADLLDPPAAWRGAFEFVLESYTLQALPAPTRHAAMAKLATLVAPGGTLLVICRAREPHNPAGAAPWPLTRDELHALVSEGSLVETTFEDYLDVTEDPPVRRFRCAYRRRG
jgi:SAM-dependent methyltransferase